MPGIQGLVQLMMGSQISWLIVLGLFMGVSYVAQSWALSAVNPGKQYLGLVVYVVAEAVIFVPLLYIAGRLDSRIIPTAGMATLVLFGGLTAIVFVTRKDFSFLRTVLVYGGFAAFGLIVVAVLFNFALGPIFTYTMIALASGYILYHTSNVLYHYRIGQHVAAALALFASVALLFLVHSATLPLPAQLTARLSGPKTLRLGPRRPSGPSGASFRSCGQSSFLIHECRSVRFGLRCGGWLFGWAVGNPLLLLVLPARAGSGVLPKCAKAAVGKEFDTCGESFG